MSRPAAAPVDVDGPAAPPRRNGELVFAEPWESRAFGLAVALHATGTLPWDSFRRELISAISAWEGEPFAYYRCWLDALERAVVSQGLVSDADLVRRGRRLAARAPDHDHDRGHAGGTS